MIAPVVEAFAEVLPVTYAIEDLIAAVPAAGHCSFLTDGSAKPAGAKGMSHTHTSSTDSNVFLALRVCITGGISR